MILITKEIAKRFQKQGDTSEKDSHEIKVLCKLFNPVGAETWYLYEKLDDGGTDERYMAFVNLGDSQMAELGAVSLTELKSLRLPMGLSIERDRSFEPQLLSEIMEIVKSGGHV